MYDDLVANARNKDIKSILSYYGKEFYKNNCKCIFHNDNNRSAYITKGNRLRCASTSCILNSTNYSTIDVVKYYEGIQDTREASKRVLEICNTPINYNNGFIDKEPSKKELSLDTRRYLAENKNISTLIQYLNSRGISKNVLPILNKNKITYGADKFNQVHFFFNRYNFAIYRSKTQNKNFNCGEVKPICIKANNTNTWYILEGIYDGLSLLQFNNNVIVLNSVSNVKKLIDKVKTDDKLHKLKYIIATDNDDPGLAARNKLEIFFKENNISYDLFNTLYNSKCKDVNDLIKGGMYENKTTLI